MRQCCTNAQLLFYRGKIWLMPGEKNLEINTPFLLASPSLLESSRAELNSSEGIGIRQMLILPGSKNELTGAESIFKGRDQKWRRKLD